jgi:prepilin-type N-terminal cleavage/methylation domain-containing protein
MRNRGFTLLEIIVGATIISGSLLGIIHIFGGLAQISSRYPAMVKAAFLLEETAEAARVLRDSHWSNLAEWPPGETYHLVWTGSLWATSSAPVLLEGFARTLTVSEAYRDLNYDLVAAGAGSADSETRFITARVAWSSGGATSTKELSFYLTNLFNE